MLEPIDKRRSILWCGIVLLALPAIAVQIWLVAQFRSYLGTRFIEDLGFALAFCALLVLVARWRLLGLLSWPVATSLYLLWLLLVLSEAVSYYLQADTFNDRFFAHLDPENLSTGLHAFPLQIGGGLLLLAAMTVLCGVLMRRLARRDGAVSAHVSGAAKAATLVALVVLTLTLDSPPRRLIHYLLHYEKLAEIADTPQARSVYRQLDPDPVSRARLLASPGRNLVLIYMESLERMYADPKAFPGLTPNLDRLRAQGLDFSGFESFDGATYTIAGMFASQCGAPLFTSPFAAFDYAAGNNNDETTFQPKLVCLGDVLHAAGYDQVYIGGAPISFSNKGLFYKMHGYDQALGLDELEAAAGGNLPNSGWGLYDQDLFRLALNQYRQLEQSGKPFNLTMITLDTHPPDGRPSPGCPRYTASSNSMLQSIHCTDYLIGQFIAQLSREASWRNTVVAVMSDHLALRNDSEPLYPKGYHRQPLLFVLNAGQGERSMRFYHMDVAPTLLDLLGVHNNATFLAGADRAEAGALSSRLVSDDLTDAVIRDVLWANANEFHLCKNDTLLSSTPDGFRIGGRELPMNDQGEAETALDEDEVLTFFLGPRNASLLLAQRDDLNTVLAQRGEASALMIRPLHPYERKPALFSVDWLGRRGAFAHIADLQRLSGLRISSPDCRGLLARADAAPPGEIMDYAARFTARTDPPFPELPALPAQLDFSDGHARAYKREIGWLSPQDWGSFARGDRALVAFRLPREHCHAAVLRMDIDPYLPRSRPNLDVQVLVNGSLATTWHFKGPDVDDPNAVNAVQQASAPLRVNNDSCDALVEMRFSRPGGHPPPWPDDEDARNLQLRLVAASVEAPGAAPVHAVASH